MALNSAQLIATGQLDGFRNRIINGAMAIDQRNSGASNASTAYGVDRWYQEWSSTGVTLAFQQVTDTPSGFTNSLKVTVSTGSASFTNSAAVYQAIEGNNFADMAFGTASAKTVTLSFWVKSTLTGSFGGSLRNADFGQNYPFTYTISAANTWEYKTVSIPGSVTGTWAKDNTIGAILTFGLGAVSARKATANTWAASIARQPTGTVDLIATTGATWQVTGVQLEKGPVATDFDFRSYPQELAMCQRYYQSNLRAIFSGQTTSSSSYGACGNFQVPMRATPTISSQTIQWNLTFDTTAASVEDISNTSVRFVKSANGNNFAGRFETIYSAAIEL